MLPFDVDLEIKDYAGDTAARVAEIYNQGDCLEVIREHLSRQNEEAKHRVRDPPGGGSEGDRLRLPDIFVTDSTWKGHHSPSKRNTSTSS